MSDKTNTQKKKIESNQKNKKSENANSAKKAKSTKNTEQKKINKSEDTKKAKKRDEKVSSIIKEQIANINDINRINEIEEKEEKQEEEERKKAEKNNKTKKNKIDEAKIEAEIEAAKKMPKDKKMQINKKVFTNVLWAIIATIYLILINLGGINVKKTIFETDLKVFSLCLLTITIIIFEKAYNKDSGTLAIFGIETLVMGIITLVSSYVYILYKNMFIYIIGTISGIAIMYYIIKCIIIIINERKSWKNTISDVKKIVSES